MGGKTSLGPDCETPWLRTRNARQSINIAQKAKYELIQIQKKCGGPSLTQPNPTAMEENETPIEATPDMLSNHLPGAPLRSVCAVLNANASTLTDITTNNREIGRKFKGPLTSGETPISPNAPSARPCSDRSQELPLPEVPRPAVIALAPAKSASMLISQTVSGSANLRKVSDPSGFSIRRFAAAHIASRMPHKASSHQMLLSARNKMHLLNLFRREVRCVHHEAVLKLSSMEARN
jgi:hypothetical protein